MLRQVVPFRGSILGHCYHDATERDLSVGASDRITGYFESDALPYVKISNLTTSTIYLRIPTPHYAQIVEAYLDLQCSVQGANGLRAVLAPASGLSPVILTPVQINEKWLAVRGSNVAVMSSGGKIRIDGLNLKASLPEIGRDDEIMALVLVFDTPPQQFKLERLNLLIGTEMLV